MVIGGIHLHGKNTCVIDGGGVCGTRNATVLECITYVIKGLHADGQCEVFVGYMI